MILTSLAVDYKLLPSVDNTRLSVDPMKEITG